MSRFIIYYSCESLSKYNGKYIYIYKIYILSHANSKTVRTKARMDLHPVSDLPAWMPKEAIKKEKNTYHTTFRKPSHLSKPCVAAFLLHIIHGDNVFLCEFWLSKYIVQFNSTAVRSTCLF